MCVLAYLLVDCLFAWLLVCSIARLFGYLVGCLLGSFFVIVGVLLVCVWLCACVCVRVRMFVCACV